MFIKTLFEDPFLYLRIVVIVMFSIILHELGHGWAAMSQGDDTPKTNGHLTFDPLVHMGTVSIIFLFLAGIAWGQMPVNPRKFRWGKWGDIFVSAAGPMMNLLLGLLGIIVLKIIFISPLHQIISDKFFYLIAELNLALFMFNLLPVPPLDGFHILSQLFPTLQGLEKEPLGQFLFVILFMSGASGYLFKIADWLINLLVYSTSF